MKTAIKLTLAVVLMMSATSLFAQKFGRINTSEIIASMPEMKQMQVDMENFGKTLNEGIEAINVEYANKLQEYQKSYNSLPEATREMKAQDLQNLITAMTRMQYDYPGVILRHVRRVTLTTEENLPWSLDGEYCPSAPRVEIENLPAAIQLVR